MIKQKWGLGLGGGGERLLYDPTHLHLLSSVTMTPPTSICWAVWQWPHPPWSAEQCDNDHTHLDLPSSVTMKMVPATTQMMTITTASTMIRITAHCGSIPGMTVGSAALKRGHFRCVASYSPLVVGWFVPYPGSPPWVQGYLLCIYTTSMLKGIWNQQYSASSLIPRSLPNGLGMRIAHSTWTYRCKFSRILRYLGLL